MSEHPTPELAHPHAPPPTAPMATDPPRETLPAAPAAAPTPPEILQVATHAYLTWYQQVEDAADRTQLGAHFGANAIATPEPSFLLVATVESGVDALAYRFFSLGDSGFLYSVDDQLAQRFWPASTVKLAAAVAALMALAEHGLDGDAQVSMEDENGLWQGSVRDIYTAAIVPSSNPAYNRLMMIAGFDAINAHYLPMAMQLPHMVLQRRYARKAPDANMRTSVPITYVQGEHQGTLPERIGTSQHPRCPNEGNCTTLLELLDVIRRVALDAELHPAERYPLLSEADRQALRQALGRAPSCIGDGAAEVLGPVEVFNKGGKYVDDDRLEVALISQSNGSQRFLVAISLPYRDGIEAETNRLTAESLRFLQREAHRAPPLQEDAGTAPPIHLRHDPLRLELEVAPTDTGAAWVNGIAQPWRDTLDLDAIPPRTFPVGRGWRVILRGEHDGAPYHRDLLFLFEES